MMQVLRDAFLSRKDIAEAELDGDRQLLDGELVPTREAIVWMLRTAILAAMKVQRVMQPMDESRPARVPSLTRSSPTALRLWTGHEWDELWVEELRNPEVERQLHIVAELRLLVQQEGRIGRRAQSREIRKGAEQLSDVAQLVLNEQIHGLILLHGQEHGLALLPLRLELAAAGVGAIAVVVAAHRRRWKRGER